MSKWIEKWDVENPEFWEKEGKKIANRNLAISVPALLVAFSVWMIWSVTIVKLPDVGFQFTQEQLFYLAALPPLSGATLRIFYSFMIPVFGGRLWTFLSTLSLLIPVIGTALAIQNPNTSYATFVFLALLSGFGGGNFASSMSNISYFFPKAKKGMALGINAGIGNLGVSIAQFSIPLLVTVPFMGGEARKYIGPNGVEKVVYVENLGYYLASFIIILLCVFIWFGMDSISSAKSSIKNQLIIFKSKHNWIMCFLYIGTFGSFIGYSSAFPTLIKSQFPQFDPLKYAFLGPLVGALSRPIGGIIADKLGGARVTFWNFILMIIAVIGVIFFIKEGSFLGYFMMFMILFITTGVGNGSTFRMIPIIYSNIYERDKLLTREQMLNYSARDGATVLGFSSAIGAYGGFFIPKMFGYSVKNYGNFNFALYSFIVFYAVCLILTYWYYSRKNAENKC